MRYVILERTPYPGYFAPMATCDLQRAEYDLRIGRHYHDRAQPLGALLTYTEQDASRIIEHRQQVAPYADLLLFGIPVMG